jgi:hypothetical protein
LRLPTIAARKSSARENSIATSGGFIAQIGRKRQHHCQIVYVVKYNERMYQFQVVEI